MDQEIIDGKVFDFNIETEDDNERVDIFLNEHIPEASRSLIQKLIRSGNMKINGTEVAKTNHRVQRGDVIEFRYEEPISRDIKPLQVNFEILFEDDDLIVVNKPAGLMVHPGAGRQEPTLVEGVLYHLQGRMDFNDEVMQTGRPGIVHRLDADTSGAIVIAKNAFTHARLGQQFHDKTNIRIYKALLCGDFPEPDLTIRSYLYRDPKHRTSFASLSETEYEQRCKAAGRPSLAGFRFSESYFKREKVYFHSLSLVSIKLSTGRTHQIRVHAKSVGRPVAGDPMYGGDLNMVSDLRVQIALRKLNRQMLHAETLGFVHPRTEKKLAFQANPPADFLELTEFLNSLS